MQYNLVQSLSIDCPSPLPFVLVLQLKCIYLLLVPVILFIKTQLSSSFLPIKFVDLVLAPLTDIVWNHGPLIREPSSTSVPVVGYVSAILGKVKTFDAGFVGRAGTPFLYLQSTVTKEEGQVHGDCSTIQLKESDEAVFNEGQRF